MPYTSVAIRRRMSSTSTKPHRTGGVVGRGGGSPKSKSCRSDDSIDRSLLRTQTRPSFDNKDRGAARRTGHGRDHDKTHSSHTPGGNQHDGAVARRDAAITRPTGTHEDRRPAALHGA